MRSTTSVLAAVAYAVLAGLALLGSAHPSTARIHGQMYCWGFDSELPVPCDYEEDEEEVSGSGIRIRDYG